MDSPSQVIEVGSATANAPGYAASRRRKRTEQALCERGPAISHHYNSPGQNVVFRLSWMRGWSDDAAVDTDGLPVDPVIGGTGEECDGLGNVGRGAQPL